MFVEFLIFVIFVLLCAYHNVTKRWKKFHRRGIPFAEPYFPLGSWHNWKLLILPNGSFSEQYRVSLEETRYLKFILNTLSTF